MNTDRNAINITTAKIAGWRAILDELTLDEWEYAYDVSLIIEQLKQQLTDQLAGAES
jgi:hypothetical protein